LVLLAQQPAGHIEAKIVAVRTRIQEAVRARDAAALRRPHDTGVTHTQGSGKVERRGARIVAPSAGVGEPGSSIRHADTGIAGGRSPILAMAEKRHHAFRSVEASVSTGGDRQLMVSRATRLPPAV
jgi:hypothetical protein